MSGAGLTERAFEHVLITIRESAPHKQAKAIFPRDHAGLSRSLPCLRETKHIFSFLSLFSALMAPLIARQQGGEVGGLPLVL